MIRKHCNCLEYYIRYAVADEDGRSRCALVDRAEGLGPRGAGWDKGERRDPRAGTRARTIIYFCLSRGGERSGCGRYILTFVLDCGSFLNEKRIVSEKQSPKQHDIILTPFKLFHRQFILIFIHRNLKIYILSFAYNVALSINNVTDLKIALIAFIYKRIFRNYLIYRH